MADVRTRTEDWKTLPWKDIQRNVFRLQQRIYRAARHGANDNGPYSEEPREGEALMRGSVVGADSAMAPPTITEVTIEKEATDIAD